MLLSLLNGAEGNGLSVQIHRSGRGFLRTVDDFHKRRFSRAVFTHHNMDGSFFNTEADIIQRDYAGERLCDSVKA